MDLLREGDICGKLTPRDLMTTQPRGLRGSHKWTDLKAIRTCLICRRDKRDRKFEKERSGNKGSQPRTRGRTGDFMSRFHYMKGVIESI